MIRRKVLVLSMLVTSLGALAACGTPTAAPGASGGAGSIAPGDKPEEAFEEGGNLEVPASMVAEALDQGMPLVFLDARDKLNYEAGHIPGAINVPFFDVDKHLDSVPKDKWLIAYCACPTAEAKQLADQLLNKGYTKVKVIQEGLDGWTGMGRELEKGTPAP